MAFEVFCPGFVVVDTNRQTDAAIVVFGEVREAAAGIDHVAIEAQMVFPCFGAAVVGNGVCGAIETTGAAFVAEGSNTGIDRMVDIHFEVGHHTAHAEERAQFRMDDGTMAAQFTKTRFQSDRNMKQVAVANGMFDTAGITQGADRFGEADNSFAKCEIHAEAFNGRSP